jgi:hypothetical protein
MKVFLGGTCNETTWRDELIALLECDYFNPVVDDWTPACIDNEYKEKQNADYQLYVITPAATGCFSIAELIDASNKYPTKTVCALIGDWDNEIGRYKSFNESMNVAENNGAIRLYSLVEIADFFNGMVVRE